MTYISKSQKQSFNIGVSLAKNLKIKDIVLLYGSIGAGKSVIASGIAYGLGINEKINSPTFTIVNEYYGKYKLNHFDFYRIKDPYELYEIGFEEYIYSDSVSIIEWPEKGGEFIPDKNIIKVNIKILNKNTREIEILWI